MTQSEKIGRENETTREGESVRERESEKGRERERDVAFSFIRLVCCIRSIEKQVF